MKLRFFKRHHPATEGAASWVTELTPQQRRILKFNLKSLLESKEALSDRDDPRYDGRPNRSPRAT